MIFQFLQGLGLLINLVEYSARNRHCLVNMETSCSFDSFCAGEGDDSLKITGQIDAVQALVQVRNEPKMCFSCNSHHFSLSDFQGRRTQQQRCLSKFFVTHFENVIQHSEGRGVLLTTWQHYYRHLKAALVLCRAFLFLYSLFLLPFLSSCKNCKLLVSSTLLS